MNLLFLDSVDRDTFGGYENWIILVARYFSKRGHQVSAVGRPASEYLRRVGAACADVDCIELPISGDFNPLTIWKLKKILEQRRVDLMTVNFNKDVRLGGLAARWYGHTKVCWRMGLDITAPGWAHRKLSPRLVDGIIVPSQALKRQVMQHGYLTDEMIEVIYNGTEDMTFTRPDPKSASALRAKYGLSENSLVAVTVGRFVDQKGHIYLVEAAREIIAAVPEVIFLFLGDGEHETLLRETIARHGMQDHFVLAGMLDSIDLELAGSDLLVHPAIEEPFSHGILESMRAGLPIVASRVGGIPEAVIENESALLVEATNVSALAQAVIAMLQSPDQRVRFGRLNQDRWHEHFRVKTMVRRTEAYLVSILGRESL